MTLRIYDQLEQGSPEWLEARRGILTASVIGRLITPTGKVADNDTSRGLTNTLAGERMTSRVVYVHPNMAMQRGTMDEPYSRDVYSDHFAPVTEVGFITNTFNGHTLGYSPDGLIGDDGLFETKSRDPKVHIETVLNGVVPKENMAQLQAGLLVTGRAWIDYCSYCSGLPLYVIRVTPEPAWFDVILEALDTFEDNCRDVINRFATATLDMPQTEYVDHFAEIEIGF